MLSYLRNFKVQKYSTIPIETIILLRIVAWYPKAYCLTKFYKIEEMSSHNLHPHGTSRKIPVAPEACHPEYTSEILPLQLPLNEPITLALLLSLRSSSMFPQTNFLQYSEYIFTNFRPLYPLGEKSQRVF